MKKVNVKSLLEILLDSYGPDEMYLLKDGERLISVGDARAMVKKMKDEATQDQIEFESALDNLMHEFPNVFPEFFKSEVVEGSWPKTMQTIWNDNVKPELSAKYSNL
jgi:hypothetical protein